jgi:putative DNA primase/helicase
MSAGFPDLSTTASSAPILSNRGSTDFARAMGPVARQLLGNPTSETSRELRFGSRGSMCVDLDKGTWFDNEAGIGGGVLDLVIRDQHLDKAGAVRWLQDQRHIEAPAARTPFVIKATYDYVDERGALLFQVCRLDPKDFRQRRPDPEKPGKWIWKTKDVRTVLYHLPDIIASVAAGKTIFVTEGEKGADALRALGFAATCSPKGAGKWRREHGEALRGADVVIVPDNDDPGRNHAALVASNLRSIHTRAARIRVLTLPDLEEKSDVFDWIQSGGTADQFRALADQAPDAPSVVVARKEPPPTIDQDGNQLDGFDLTEDGIALAFTAAFHDKLRYCHTTGAWFEWTGKAWRRDERKRAFSWARRVCREMARSSGAGGSELAKVSKAATAGAVERFAQADETFAVTAAIWDNDPLLMGTPGGTLDLLTGLLRDPEPDDHITKLTACTPSQTALCPLWLKFLAEATGDDEALIRFLQQWCGYALTGDTREHALLFVYGPGGNGKSVFLNVVSGILGEYAKTAPMDSFTASQSERHPTDMAGMKGARLVTASETEEGRAWAEAKIKAMTGGDTISARFMRQDFFEYRPEFKLTIVGNHKPQLRNIDEAAKRRFNIVPFVRKPANPDRELEQKLRAEWPGIMRWMIDGCQDWQRNGLVRPPIVVEATSDYFAAQDSFGAWIAERCICDTSLQEKPGKLLGDFNEWASQNGEYPATRKTFRGWAERQTNLRYKTVRGSDFVQGLGLKVAPSDRQGAQGGDGWR